MGILIFILCIALAFPILDFYTHEKDSTDKPKEKWWHRQHRSGLRVYVDHATGVHYVRSHPFDRLHVRIKADGTPYTDADEKLKGK